MTTASQHAVSGIRKSVAAMRDRQESNLAQMRGRAHTKTSQQWCDLLGIGRTTLYRYLRALDEGTKPATKDTEQVQERQRRVRWVRRNAPNMTRAQMSKVLGVAMFSVDRYLREAGVKAKPEQMGTYYEDRDVAVMKRWASLPLVGRTHASALRAIERDREDGLL